MPVYVKWTLIQAKSGQLSSVRAPSMSTVSVPNGMLLRAAWCSTKLTPHAAMPAMNDSPVLTASPGPDGESMIQWFVRAELSVRPSVSVVFERVEYLFLISAIGEPPSLSDPSIDRAGGETRLEHMSED